jgi:ribosomal protein L29
VRKAIARALTIITQKKRDELRSQLLKNKAIKAYNTANKTTFSPNQVPFNFRVRATRSIRHRVTRKQERRQTTRQLKRFANYPQRNFAIKTK